MPLIRNRKTVEQVWFWLATNIFYFNYVTLYVHQHADTSEWIHTEPLNHQTNLKGIFRSLALIVFIKIWTGKIKEWIRAQLDLFIHYQETVGFACKSAAADICWSCFWPLEHLSICDHISVTKVPPRLRSQSERWNPLAYGRITPTCQALPCLFCHHHSLECLVSDNYAVHE